MTLPRSLQTGNSVECKNDSRMRHLFLPHPFSQCFSYFTIPRSTCKEKPSLPSSQSPRPLPQLHHKCLEGLPTQLNLVEFRSPLQTRSTAPLPPKVPEALPLNALLQGCNYQKSSWWYQWQEGGGTDDLREDPSPGLGPGWEQWEGHAVGVFLASSTGKRTIFFQILSSKWQSLSTLKCHLFSI